MPVETDVNLLQKELENYETKNEGLREELDHANTELSSLADENTYLRKKVSSLQQDFIKQHNEFSRIETQLYQQEQETEKLKKENVSFLKNKREVERKLREETLAYEKDRSTWHERESELFEQIKTLQETLNVLAQQDAQKKNDRNSTSPVSANFGFNSIFSPSSALSSLTSRLSSRESTSDDSRPSSPTAPNFHNVAREAKVAQKTIKEQDRLILQLKTEIERVKSATTDSLNINKGLSLTNAALKNELDQIKVVKRSLEEENEAFQLLLHEKTIKGEFMLNPVLQRHDSRLMSPISNKGNIFNINRSDNTGSVRDGEQRPKSIVTNLAAELDRANNNSVTGEEVQKESDHVPNFEAMQEEIKSLQDENKSLKLYINKILDRIMEAQGFEEILSADTDWTKKSNPSTPISSLFQARAANMITDLDAETKVERRKTLTFPLRKTSPEKPSQIKTSTRSSTTSISFVDDCTGQDESTPPLTKSPTRLHGQRIVEETVVPSSRRAHSISESRQRTQGDGGPRKRWSLWWGNEKLEEPKHDPYMRPMILVQEKEKSRD